MVGPDFAASLKEASLGPLRALAHDALGVHPLQPQGVVGQHQQVGVGTNRNAALVTELQQASRVGGHHGQDALQGPVLLRHHNQDRQGSNNDMACQDNENSENSEQ